MIIDDHTVKELQKHVLPVCGYTHTQSVASDITGRRSTSHGYLAKQTTPTKYELTTTTNERNEKKKTLTTKQDDKKKTKDSTTS